VTASMLRRTEPVLSLVPRFLGRVQSKRAAAPTSWTRRFARRSVAAAIASLRSACRVIAGTRTARARVVRRRVRHQCARPGNAISAVPKAVSIIATISGRTAPA
jgi:hypothetical protein